jgi:hypothetical protein
MPRAFSCGTYRPYPGAVSPTARAVAKRVVRKGDVSTLQATQSLEVWFLAIGIER